MPTKTNPRAEAVIEKVGQLRTLKDDIELLAAYLQKRTVQQAEQQTVKCLNEVLRRDPNTIREKHWNTLIQLRGQLKERRQMAKDLEIKKREFENLTNNFLGRNPPSE